MLFDSLSTKKFFYLGVTCSKSITLTIHDTIFHIKKDQSPIRHAAPGHLVPSQRIQIIKNTFYDIILTQHGISIMWDRGTKFYLTLDPKYKGVFNH